MTTRLLVAALAATASLAACGGEGPAKTSARPDARKAMLKYASCMREHGVDMPDPRFEGNRVMMKGPAKADPGKLRSAEKACASIRESLKAPEMSDGDKEKFKQAALANARCMREHGIDKFPDPTFGEDGGAQIQLRRGGGIDPESPKFQAAAKACRSTLPDFGSTDSTDG